MAEDAMDRINREESAARLAFVEAQERARLAGLTAKETYRIHRERLAVEVLNETGKISMAINGGAAIAMGALLQTLWDKGGISSVRTALLWGILWCTLGVATAGLTFLFRYFSMCRPIDNVEFPLVDNRWGVAALVTGIASVLAFLGGVGYPVVIALLL
jgi:hypothetical protein